MEESLPKLRGRDMVNHVYFIREEDAMRKLVGAILLPIFSALALPASAVTVAWTDWQSSTTNSASGVIDVGGETIDVSFTNSVSNGFVQTGAGTDFWIPRNESSPYTSTGPVGNSNPPTGTDIIALGAAGTRTLSFSKEVQGLYFSYVSWNGNVGTFSTSMTKLSETGKNIDGSGVDANGFWGGGTLNLSEDGLTFQAVAGEPHGTLYAAAPLRSFTFTSSSEFWHGFTVGIAGLAATPPPPAAVIPLPAAGFMLLGALGGLAVLRRRRH
jgi:hypothetical protein